MLGIKKKYTSDEILDGLRRNDSIVIEYFYKTVKQLIWKYVKNNKGSDEDARDLCHDVVIIFYRQLMSENLDLRNSYSSYIYILARNIWLKQLKKMDKIGSDDYDLDTFQSSQSLKEIDDVFVDYIKNKMFWKHFSKLKDDCKVLLRMTFQNISDDEIAKELGVENKIDIIKRKSRCKFYLIESVRKDPMFTQVFDYEY